MLASTVACLQTLLPHYMSCPKSLTVLTIFLDICRKAHPAPPPKKRFKLLVNLLEEKWCPAHPIIHIDDSDVVKPEEYKFESLGWVRDGSESTATKNVYKKEYHITKATSLANSKHPVSLFSEVHSSTEKNFTFINDITFSAMERAAVLFGKATFVINRDYVIRLTAKRRLLYHNK